MRRIIASQRRRRDGGDETAPLQISRLRVRPSRRHSFKRTDSSHAKEGGRGALACRRRAAGSEAGRRRAHVCPRAAIWGGACGLHAGSRGPGRRAAYKGAPRPALAAVERAVATCSGGGSVAEARQRRAAVVGASGLRGPDPQRGGRRAA
eukprot:scaffold1819_cov311-Prasinococcus_capsulatus_cf.AAC.5